MYDLGLMVHKIGSTCAYVMLRVGIARSVEVLVPKTSVIPPLVIEKYVSRQYSGRSCICGSNV